jgi:hypothetical protein
MLQIVIETEHIHGTWVKLVRFVAFVLKLLVNIALVLPINK